MLLLALLIACGDARFGPDEVTITCEATFQQGDMVDVIEDYSVFAMSCDQWADHGEVQASSEEGACESDGIDQGYDTADCTCVWDTGRCQFPHGVND